MLALVETFETLLNQNSVNGIEIVHRRPSIKESNI